MPASCKVSARVSPPMPAPTIIASMPNALVLAPRVVSQLSDYRMGATFPHAVAAVQSSRERRPDLSAGSGIVLNFRNNTGTSTAVTMGGLFRSPAKEIAMLVSRFPNFIVFALALAALAAHNCVAAPGQPVYYGVSR